MKRSFCSLALALTTLAISANTLLAGSDDGRFDIYWVDVEGGAATLMVTPRGESVLIDSGNPGHRDPDRIVKVATQVAGLKRIDFLITTHYHRDHYGGAATLAKLRAASKHLSVLVGVVQSPHSPRAPPSSPTSPPPRSLVSLRAPLHGLKALGGPTLTGFSRV